MGEIGMVIEVWRLLSANELLYTFNLRSDNVSHAGWKTRTTWEESS